MIRDVVAFEWRYHARQVTFPAAAALFFLFGFGLAASGYGPDNIHINSPYSITQSLGLLSLAAIFLMSVFCANAVVRDREHRMEEIVFSTAVEKFHYLFGRFTGSFLAGFTAFSMSAAGMLAGTLLVNHDPASVGPVRVGHYLWALLVMALPNLLLTAVVLFAIATLTRSVLASHVGAVFLYVLYFVGAALTNSPLMAASVPGGQSTSPFSILLDPFGLSAFFEQTRYWTPAVRNVRLIALTGNFLLNRLAVIGLALVGLAIVYRLFAFRVVSDAKRKKAEERDETPATAHYAPVAQRLSQWAAFRSAARVEIVSVLKSVPFLLLLLLWAGLAASEVISAVASGEYGSALLPTTSIVFSELRAPLHLIGLIVLVYYSTEIVWRERSVRMAQIIDATPSSNVTFVGAKATALAVMVLALIGAEIVVATVIQLGRGWMHVEPALIASFAWFDGLPLLFFAIAALFIHSLAPQKYLGMFLVLVFAVLTEAGGRFGLEHHLWRFGTAPPVVHSDMNGFGHAAAAFNWYALHWAILAALLLLVAATRWRKGAAEPIHRALAAALCAAFVASGAHIFYNTNVINEHRSSADVLQWRADYERTYKAFAGVPQPRIAGIQASLDLNPNERSYRAAGRYTIVNESTAPMEKVLVAVRREARNVSLAIPGAKLLNRDSRFGHYWFQLAQPLPPGARSELQFDLTFANPGFVDGNDDNSVVANGSFITSNRCFPTLGYRSSYEIGDPAQRRRYGLRAKPENEGDEEQREDAESEWTSFDVTLSTAPDQIAVATGKLEREWVANGRRFFHYRSESPVPNGFAFVSARYAIARDGRVAVYYHPAHQQNVARMLDAASQSLKAFEQSFGPYPHGQLKIVEIPGHWQGFAGMARPDTLYLGETRTFLIDARDPNRLDLISRRVAHEVGHQWWGLSVAPAEQPGGLAITESLAKYSELLMLERLRGREEVRRSLTYELDLYLAGRAEQQRAEVPLRRVGSESYLYYRKGAIVMHALKDLLGEAAMNEALHRLYAAEAGAGHSPGSAALVAELNAVATPQQRVLINEWMNEIVLYDFKLLSAKAKRLPDGRFEVTMQIAAAKTNEPLHEAIEVGLFSRTDAPLAVAKVLLHDGANVVTMTVAEMPLSAVVDPYVCRIDRNRFDNEKRVE